MILPKGEIYLPCHACTKVQRMTGVSAQAALALSGRDIRANTKASGSETEPGFGRQPDWEDYAMLALELGTLRRHNGSLQLCRMFQSNAVADFTVRTSDQ